MANSFDWLGALAAPPPSARPEAPQWLAQFGAVEARFRAAPPFAEAGNPASGCEAAAPPPDPLAEARARAFAEGEAAGRAAAEAEAAARGEHHRTLRLAFRALDEAAIGVLAEDLAATVMTLTDGVLAEVAIDPAGLAARCRVAAARLGGAAERIALHLHPEDIALLGEALAGWAVVPDPALGRGALRIEGPDGSVSDGPEEWRRAIAAAVRG